MIGLLLLAAIGAMTFGIAYVGFDLSAFESLGITVVVLLATLIIANGGADLFHDTRDVPTNPEVYHAGS